MTGEAVEPPRPEIGAALGWAQARLQYHSPSAALDAQVLLAELLDVDRSYLLAWPERSIAATQRWRFAARVARRATGVPVAQLTGWREFWSLRLRVSRATLTPRPETEMLVEAALESLPAGGSGRVLDLGTGSGALALAIAAERPGTGVDAVERDPAALAQAQANGRGLGLANLRWLPGDWYAPVAGRRYAVVVSNPPYVDAAEPEFLDPGLAWEPAAALYAEGRPLAALQRVVAGAAQHLLPGGRLAVEHGFRQGAAVRELFRAAGLQRVESRRDLQGHERITVGLWLRDESQG